MHKVEMLEAEYFGNEFAGFNTSKNRLTIVRRSDLFVKVVDGPEAKLAGDLLHDTGEEMEFDSIMEKVSGRWSKPQRLGFAISNDSRWLAWA
jgi:hypothetical protein